MTGTEEACSPSGDPGSPLSAAKRYNLRLCSQVNRVLVERRREEPRKKKPKSKPPPLSKYRRKTANSRERTRMTEINQAFEDLRNVIPQYPPGKMTKITTLRLALNYLGELRDLLGYPPADIATSSSSSGTEAGSSSETASSSGSMSDCATSPEPAAEPSRTSIASIASIASLPSLPAISSSTSSSSSSSSSCALSDLQEDPFSDLADTDSDTSLNQLFELNLDGSLQDTPLQDTPLQDTPLQDTPLQDRPLDTSLDTSLDSSLDSSLDDLPPIDLPS